MNLHRIAHLLLLCFSVTPVFSQTSATVKGKVLDPEGKSMPFATVMLMRSTDKVFVKGALTDTAGVYILPKIASGQYYVSASFVGTKGVSSQPFSVQAGDQVNVPTLSLLPAENSTQVTITGQRPLIQLEPDRVTMNVEGTTNATGANGLELLQKAPGVTIDNDDNISLQGRNSVKIYIDGRPTQMSGKDLANFLRSMQSSNVDKIDLITNPSARYDASGNAGIIDIRLKKNTSWGTNGTFSTGGAQGRNTRYNGNVTFNNRSEKTNVFGSVGHNGGPNANDQLIYRIQAGQIYDQTSKTVADYNNTNMKLGLDYTLSNKKTIGVMADGNYATGTWTSNGRTPIMNLDNTPKELLVATNRIPGSRNNFNVNANYRFADTRAKKEFNLDADRGGFRNRGESYQPNTYYTPDGATVLRQFIYKNSTPTDVDIYTLKGDYSQPVGKAKLDLGFKFSYVKTDNTFDFWDVINNVDVKNLDRSNTFAFKENINAAYVNYGKRLNPKLNLQAGLRLEQTNSEGQLTSAKPQTDDNVKRTYLDVFPSASASMNLNPKNMLNVSVTRRIDRPSYQQLNPFENKLDELTYQKGNAFLKPQYTNKLDVAHTYKYKYTTTFSFSRTRDFFTQIMDTTETNRTFITQKNLAKQEVMSLNIGAPVQIKKGWNAYLNANVNRSFYKADFGSGKVIDLAAIGYTFYGQTTYALSKNTTAEASGFYNGPFIWGGTFKSKPMGGLDLGVSQKLFNDRGTLKVTFTDVLGTLRFRGTTNFGGLNTTVGSTWEARQLRFTFSYRFGSNEVKGSRQRKTGSEDEARRSSGGGGGIGNK